MADVILVDDDDNVLGETSRARAHAEGLLHRIAVTYVVNGKGEILVNVRAKDGHLDHSSAGHVDVGESYLDAAKRELREELGVEGVDLKEIGHAQAQDLGVQDGEPFNSRHMFKVFLWMGEPGTLDPQEVESVYWADPRAVAADMEVNPGKYAGGFRRSIQVYFDFVQV